MNTASCLCGSVRWEVDGPLQFVTHCHCSRCRKTHGAAFATLASAALADYRLHGAEHVASWRSSVDVQRRFCARCGSVVAGGEYQGMIFLPMGNFDGDPGVQVLAHIFTASKAGWYEISDGLPQFEAYPDGVEATVLADRPPLDPPGPTRGSCACGQVSYVIDGPLLRCMNCHCGRCRKARSAAHASNLFTTADGLRFTRGGDSLGTYKVPEAERFAQAFCRHCGSPMPRVNPQTGSAVIPMGGLDDAPALRPQAHIFVGSKAPWFEITDSLPQYAEYPTG